MIVIFFNKNTGLRGGTGRWFYEASRALKMVKLILGDNKVYYRPNYQKKFLRNFRVFLYFCEYFF
jgi:hypothetical protein